MPSLQNKLNLIKDIRFWIVLFFILRMYGITFPPLEVGHNWRQTDGLMIARNFYEHDANIFFPTVDLAGDKSGVVGSEFPILNYLIYITSLLFGYDHWYGRIIVLLFSSAGIYFFYKLIRKYFDEPVAFNAAIILAASMWFSYSRKNIPDVFSASLCIISSYYALQYLERGKLINLLLFFVLGLLGCLSKILAATILTILVIPILQKEILLKRKIILSFLSAVILSAVCLWYFVWVPYLNNTYQFGDHFFMGMTFSNGLVAISNNWSVILKRYFADPIKYIGGITFLLSLFYLLKKKQWIPLLIFSLPFFSYHIIMIKTGASIAGDNYYILTVIPSMAFIIGYGLSQIKNRKIAIALLFIIGIESIADQIYDFRIRQPYLSLATLEATMNIISRQDDLIVINSEDPHNPTPMYFAHRKGWEAPNSLLANRSYLDSLQSKGCKYIVIAKHLYGDMELPYAELHNSEYFRIYDLTKAGSITSSSLPKNPQQ